jgi:predicted transporter
MGVRTRFDAIGKTMAVFASALCLVGAAAAFYVVLVRIPALASTKLDLLLGTLHGVTVGLLFAIAALLICLTYMIRQANRPPPLVSVGDGKNPVRASEPSA